ncbi:MAG: type II toxin-antitoxin system HipA family toxin [Verrucomicrobia bacterium]|nr:MAG: type II toxin-antitoxin system HipA family toxin [Verrucomicrobiota bacterium]
MAWCHITLRPVDGGQRYSREGLRQIHPRLKSLEAIDLSHEEQLRQARLRADKMSVQGVQPKLSAALRVSKGRFDVVDRGGRFILKPNPPPFEEVPANEALTMALAAVSGIEVPPHGLVPGSDGRWVYFVRRFDREGRDQRLPLEDFAQLSGATCDTKYSSSLERVADLVETFCTFPALERPKLAQRLLFCFLTGNEDMHLKNFSVLSRDGVVALAPAYDLLNTTLVLEKAPEETALPLDGKKRKLTRELWIDYFCRERLSLSGRQVDSISDQLSDRLPLWREFIDRSFLSPPRKRAYRELIDARAKRLGL